MVTISTEEYAELIRAQHSLEQIIELRDKLIFYLYNDTFDAIVGTAKNGAEFEKIAANVGKVDCTEKEVEEVWGTPHETV